MTTKNFVVKNGLTTGNIILDASNSNITANVVVANLSVPASANLGSNANVKITGGTSGQYLQTDGSGVLSWATIAPSSSYSNSNVASYLPTYTGQMANSVVAGTVYTNAQPNITSVGVLTGLTTTGDITSGGTLVSNYSAGNEGGEIKLALPQTGTTLNSSVTIDVHQNRLRIFESGGTNRGGYFDITALGAGVSTDLLAGGSGGYANSNVAAYLPVYTGNISASNVNVTGNVTSAYFVGNGSQLTGLPATYANSNVASYLPTYTGLVGGTLSTQVQPNITSVGTLASLNSGLITATSGGIKVGNIQDPSGTNTISLASGQVTMIGNLQVGTGGTGNVTATYFIGNGSQLTGLPATYSNTNVASYLPTYTGNITGNIVTLTGNVTAINASLGNLVTANHFTATGNITASNFITSGSSGNISGANNISANTFTGNLVTAAQPNITSVGTLASLNVTGNVTASHFSGSGNLLSNIQAANISGQVANSLVAGTVYTNAQPNITSVGTLTDLTISGNLVVGGTTEYTNVTNLYVKDPIIEQGGAANAGALGSNDGKDRGQLLHYYSGGVVDAFMGWDNSNAEFAFGSNVSVASEVITFNNFGNIRANYFLGNASQLVGTIANANYAAYAGVVTANAQPNITSVGTLTNVTIAGPNSVTGGNLVSANYVTGTLTTSVQPNITSVGTLTNTTIAGPNSITGGNLVSANYITGTLTTAVQPNITSVGTLASVAVTGLITAGNVTSTGNVTASYFVGAGNLLSNIVGANVTGQVANALVATTAGTVTANAQPNVTSVGVLSNLTSAGTVNFTTASNVSLGSNANVKLTGGTSGQYLQTDGTGNLAWATVAGGGGGSSISNGTSNVNIATANGNVQIVSNGNVIANVTGGGANITGTLNVSGVVTATASGIRVGNLIDPTGTSTVSIASGNVGILGSLSVGTSGAGNLTVSGKTDLGAVGNVKITGGTTGQVLTTNGSGVLSWSTAAGGGGSSLTYTAAATPPGSANVADQWFNTTTNVLYEYMNDGSASYWVDIATPTTSSLVTSNYVNHNYTGDGTTTGFTVTLGCGVNDVLVFLNGVCQAPTLDYTISGTVLTLDAAPISGTRIQIRELPR